MLISFIVLLMIPFTTISFFMAKNFRSIMIEKSYKQSEENLFSAKRRTVESLNKALILSDKISVMPQVEKIVNEKYKSSLEVFKAYRNFSFFSNYIEDNKEVTGIKLYVDNDTLLNNWEFFVLNKDILDAYWYNDAIRSNGKNIWLDFPDVTRSKNSNLSLLRQINFREYGTYGVLVVDIDTKRLSSVFPTDSYETFIVDRDGFIVSSNKDNKIGTYFKDISSDFPPLNCDDGAYDIEIDGDKYKLIVSDINLENCINKLKIYSLFSVSSIIQEANTIWRLSFKSMILVFFIALIALFSIYSLFVQRLIKVQTSIDIVSKGHFHSYIEIDGNDEIGKLALHFNNMVKNINNLLIEIETTNKQKNELEKHQNQIKLQMLASQINPHFLFNSLEAIRMKAHIDKQPEIANVVKQLGRLMRSILNVDGSWSILSDELKIIKSFLEIEKFRLDANLTYNLEIDDKCLNILLPPLLIQPLVENALIHGIEKKAGGGTLTLSAKIIKNYMHILVRDNGPGIPEDKLKDLLTGSAHIKGAHIGLRNVNERLKLSFGDESKLNITTPVGGGVNIEFKIPLEEQNG